MLKTLIVILILVLLLAIGLNVDFSTPPSTSLETTKIEMPREPIVVKKEEVLQIETNTIQTFTPKADNNLSTEIQALFNKAKTHFQNNQDEEAQNTYSLIIKKVQDNNEIKFLKYFAKAYKEKAFLFKIYPTYDNESAIEMLEMIIKKFENAEDFELIEFYINAKIEMAYMQTKEDSLDTYDELLNKFKNRTEPYFKQKIEDLLLAKSFALMGENDEEAMEILDELIAKYQKSGEKKLPESIRFSILNNIELAIITNNDDSNYRELADTYMSDSPDKEPLLDMLDIIRNAQDLDQNDALKEWQENHNSYRFPDWSFDELKKWAYRIEDKETQKRVSQYIDTFENHKYYIPSNKNTVTYSDTSSLSKNETPTVYDTEGVTYTTTAPEGVVYETEPIDYSDPYANDTPTVYTDDPYANDIPYGSADSIPLYDELADPYANDLPIIYENPYGNDEGVIYNGVPSTGNNQGVVYEPIEH